MVTPPPPTGLVAGLDVISLNIALVLGTAGLPHILIRFLTVPDAKTARSSIITATWIIGLFYLLTPVLGYGAALFVGQDAIAQQNPAGNLAAPQLAEALGGPIFFAFISAVAFATIVAVVAGLVVAASSAFAHDFYSNVIRGGNASEQEQFRAARFTADGHLRGGDTPGDTGAESERGVPCGAGLRGRRERQRAGHPADDLLEAVQHHRGGYGHAGRPDLLPSS